MSSSFDSVAVSQHTACSHALRKHWSHGTRKIHCLHRVSFQKHPAKITFAGLFCQRALFCSLCRHTLQGHGTCRSSLNMNEMKTGLVWCVPENELSSHCTAQHFVRLIHICAMTHSHVSSVVLWITLNNHMWSACANDSFTCANYKCCGIEYSWRITSAV